MKKYLIFVAACAVAVLLARAARADAPPPSRPDASACYAINNPDMRAMCLAEARGDRAHCYAITAPEIRALCRARVR